MRGLLIAGAAALVAGCVGTPTSLSGSLGAPSFAALQGMCANAPADYGEDAQPVYSAFFDAYVAYRHGRVSKEDYCAFQASIAQRHAALGSASAGRGQWAEFFNAERAKALSWRAAIDPTLRSG